MVHEIMDHELVPLIADTDPVFMPLKLTSRRRYSGSACR